MLKKYLKYSLLINILIIGFIIGWIYSNIKTPERAVVVRNSLLSIEGERSDFLWDAMHIPDSYIQEKLKAPDVFRKEISKLSSEKFNNYSEINKAIVIAKHLKSNYQDGGPIQSNVNDAYHKIINEGKGYCADYTQVFSAIALTLEIPVREWGVAFNKFGAGHAFNEVYDKTLDKWIFIDSFYSFYVKDPTTGEPFSALEFYDYLNDRRVSGDIEIVPIIPKKFGFNRIDDAIQYYKKGKNQFFLWWGNNVFSYDSDPLVAYAASFSRVIEQIVAMLIGIHPKIMILEDGTNTSLIAELKATKLTALYAFIILPILFLVFLIQVLILRRKDN